MVAIFQNKMGASWDVVFCHLGISCCGPIYLIWTGVVVCLSLYSSVMPRFLFPGFYLNLKKKGF